MPWAIWVPLDIDCWEKKEIVLRVENGIVSAVAWRVLELRFRIDAAAAVKVPVLILDTLICADVRRDVEMVEAAKAPVTWVLAARLIFVVAVAWIVILELASVPTEPAAR